MVGRARMRAEQVAGGNEVTPGLSVADVEQPLGVRQVGLAEGAVVLVELVQRERAVGRAQRLLDLAGGCQPAREVVLRRRPAAQVDLSPPSARRSRAHRRPGRIAGLGVCP